MATEYVEKGMVGIGSFGEVWLCKCKTDGKKYAMKKMHMLRTDNDMRRKNAETEVAIMCRLTHPNIVVYKDAYTVNTTVHLIMEYCEGGDIAGRIEEQKGRHFKEDRVVDWFLDICLGLQYLHGENVIHRDLKPQNILLTTTDTAKIADFGIARFLKPGDLATTAVGSPLYQSPEIVLKKPHDFKTDIWSLGCCVYEMMTLNPAIDATNLVTTGMRVTGEMPDDFSRVLTALTGQMLTHDPKSRPTIAAILKTDFVQNRIDARKHGGGSAPSLKQTLAGAKRIRQLRTVSDTLTDSGVSLDQTRTLTVGDQPLLCHPPAQDDEDGETAAEHRLTTRGGICILFSTGDLAEQKVDALVSPVDAELSFSGGASKAIADAAGIELRRECAQFIAQKKELKVTEVMHTTSGRLQPDVRYVIHAAGPPVTQFTDIDVLRDKLFATYYNCLKYANDTLKVSSLATTAISSGTFLVPTRIVAEEAHKSVVAFDRETMNSRRYLNQIHFVCLYEDGTSELAGVFSSRTT